jgi:hypothetical protein
MFQLYQPATEQVTQQVDNTVIQSASPGLFTSGHTSLYISVGATALLVVLYFTLPKSK